MAQLLHYVVEFDDGTRFDVRIDPDDASNIQVDGVAAGVALNLGPQGFVDSSSDGRRLPVTLRYEDGGLVAEAADGSRHRARVELAESREWREVVRSQPPPPMPERSGRIEAPIAGNIVALLVAEGSLVSLGAPLILLEAMKMQNTIVAPVSGTVHFAVTAGQVVRTGDLLATVGEGPGES